MSKRLNPHRRLLAKQAALRRDLAEYGNASDRGKLQEGRVRSALAPVIQLTAYAQPRPVPWEGRGKTGKVLKGQLKPVKPGTVARHSGQPSGKLEKLAMNAPHAKVVQPDSRRLHGLKAKTLAKFRYDD